MHEIFSTMPCTEVAPTEKHNLFLQACMGRESQRKEQAVLKLQVDTLQAERDVAEQDLVVLYDLYVQATRARTCHLLQVSGDKGQTLSWCQGSWPMKLL